SLFGERTVVHTLKPLKGPAIRALIRGRLHGIDVPAPVVARIAADSKGMPSLVERTLARLLVDETIVPEASGYRFEGGRYRPKDHSDAALREEAMAGLSDPQRHVLSSSAVVGWSLDAERVAYVAQCSVEETERVLAQLVRREILMPAEASTLTTYRFSRRELHASIYRAIPLPVRRALHDRAAVAVGDGRRGGIRREERAEHLLKGTDDDLAIQAALEAGDRAAEAFSDRRAIEYYARAFARIEKPDDPRAAPTALRLARLFERTGELERAATWFEAASTGETALEGLLGVARIALLRGLPELAQAAARKAQAIPVVTRSPEHEVALQRLEARIAIQGGRFREASRALDNAWVQAEAFGLERSAIATEVLLDQARAARQRGNLLEA
ncbi:MAG: hypothetical protein AAFQ82_26545, partial [Myxococcota bacterium]